jgi:Na+-transporting NADH:ubiquinone oxidoreductase subunit NqrC
MLASALIKTMQRKAFDRRKATLHAARISIGKAKLHSRRNPVSRATEVRFADANTGAFGGSSHAYKPSGSKQENQAWDKLRKLLIEAWQ